MNTFVHMSEPGDRLLQSSFQLSTKHYSKEQKEISPQLRIFQAKQCASKSKRNNNKQAKQNKTKSNLYQKG